MNSYYILLGVIALLVVINYVSLFWVSSLQKQLRHARQKVAKPAPSTASTLATVSAEHVIELQAKAEHLMEETVRKSIQKLHDDLGKTTGLINQRVGELSDKVIQDELTKYQGALDEVRQSSIDTLSEVQQAIDKRRGEMEETLAAEVAEEKKHVLERFEQHMGEVVSGYLVETLGQNIDLGAQSSYIFDTLEKHKDELKKALADGP
jgi:hypothetical protein